MSGSPSTPLARQARLLSQILKMVRDERRMKGREVAAAMGIALRTYQDFEAGRGDLDLNKIRLFAKATRSDPVGILLALFFGAPEIALLTLDSKLPMTFWITLMELRDGVGEQLNIVPPALLLSGMRRVGDDIKDWLDRHAASAESYLDKAWADIYRDPDEDPGKA